MCDRVAVFLLASLIPAMLSAGIVITDNDFADANWATGGIVTTGVGAASGTFIGFRQIAFPGDEGVAFSGNPGAFQNFQQVHGGRQNGTMTARGAYVYDAFTYDPSVHGELQNLSMSYDAFRMNNADGVGLSPSDVLTMGVVAVQNNHMFHAGAAVISTFETWTSLSFTNLVQSDFTYAGRVSPDPVLDFSTSGSAIKLGYYVFHAGNFTTRGRGGVDNFVLSINNDPVPEPSAAVVMLMVATASVFLSRKRRAVAKPCG